MRQRSSGILLHPTSLPGPHGVGDLGPQAAAFVDSLAAAGQSYWQMLPLTPPGPSQSPFDCHSAFAGNWLLISPESLAAEGFLPETPPALPGAADRVDYEAAREHKGALLRASWEHFRKQPSAGHREAFESFREGPEQRRWLDDWALFAALESKLPGRSWDAWPADLRRREPAALERTGRELAEGIAYQQYLQFLFFRQLGALRARAQERGISLIGDLPIYLSHHSADVWAEARLFELDDGGRPTAIAGVPPDAFSSTGQRWGNPLYRWPLHREEGYRWWIERLRVQMARADLLRLDHFRGFVAYWKIPADAHEALEGHWVRGPGRRMFDAVAAEVDMTRLIAEDLGIITPAVHRLRRQFGLRGMRVLQFAFDTEDSDHLPEHHETDTVVYTGTHDNDTLIGWYESREGDERRRLLDYLGAEGSIGAPEVAWRLIRVALDSVGELAVVPLQDVLGLGNEARMNRPSTAEDNWAWRMERPLDESLAERLNFLVEASGRLPADATAKGRPDGQPTAETMTSQPISTEA